MVKHPNGELSTEHVRPVDGTVVYDFAAHAVEDCADMNMSKEKKASFFDLLRKLAELPSKDQDD